MEQILRQYLRFPPDEGAVAWVDPNPKATRKDFKPTCAALVTDEALAGCGLITIFQDWIDIGTEFSVRVGRLAPIRAQVRWTKDLGGRVVRLGVEFISSPAGPP
jgi:hypothetical protein